MKNIKTSIKLGYLFAGALFLGLLIGCTPSTTTPPLAPGYANQQDETLGQTLSAMHQFAQTLSDDAATGKFKPIPAEKIAVNDFIISLNTAQNVYLAYHNGATTEDQAQLAVDTAKAKQSVVQQGVTQ